MKFRIVSAGWKNWPWLKQTVESVQAQHCRNFEMCIVDDASDDSNITDYLIDLVGQDNHFRFILNTEHMGGLYNQVAAIRAMNPDPDDVIVFLDADGDRLAHPDVLGRLVDAYADGSKVVYSTYDTEPPSPSSVRSRAHPQHVVDNNSYREFTRFNGIHWNHLRTFKAELFHAMDESDWKDDDCNWWRTVTDAAMMFPALELARGKVRFLDEVLLIYRADHDLSDWRRFPGSTINKAHDTILRRPPK